MTVYKTDITTNNVQFNIDNSNEIFSLASGQSLNTTTHGIYESANWHENTIIVNGTVNASDTGNPGYYAGIYSAGSETSIRIGTTGSVQGHYGLDVRGDFANVVNRGSIDGVSLGVSLGANNSDAIMSFTNFGTVNCASNLAVAVSDIANMTFINHGTLTGGGGFSGNADRLVLTFGEDSVIDVSGSAIRITSDAGQKAIITNFGMIDAGSWGVDGGDGNETVINRGTIKGGISLGEGNDVFDNRGGIADYLAGDQGNDTYFVSSAKLQIYESQGNGTDTVKATSSYSLNLGGGYEIEKLTLLGNGNTNGTGNQYANTIAGNAGNNVLSGLAGNDILSGGAGGDTFIFKTGFDRDTVMDFQDGLDLIDLRGFAAVTSFVDLMANHVSVSGNNLIIAAGGDELILKGIGKGDLDASDVLI